MKLPKDSDTKGGKMNKENKKEHAIITEIEEAEIEEDYEG